MLGLVMEQFHTVIKGGIIFFVKNLSDLFFVILNDVRVKYNRLLGQNN